MNYLKYKDVKYYTITKRVHSILKESSFACFFQIKNVNSKDYIQLKKQLKVFELNFLVCRKVVLTKKTLNLIINDSKLPLFAKGNLFILYSNNNELITSKKINCVDNIIKNEINILPLYFYIKPYFLSSQRFVTLTKYTSDYNKNNLIFILLMNIVILINILGLKKL